MAKSTELLYLNATDWAPFAAATGVTYDDLATLEGVVEVARQYYDWTDAMTSTPTTARPSSAVMRWPTTCCAVLRRWV